MSNCSSITMSSEEVAKLATDCIAAIDELRSEMTQHIIVDERNHWVNRFFRYVFRQPIPTDEQIIATLKMRSCFGDPLSYVEISYGRQYAIAHALLESAKYASVVSVSVADLATIRGK